MAARLTLGALLLLGAGLAPGAPLVVADDLGRELRLAQPARRVVTLAPHLAELVHAAGAGELLVGVSAYSDYPPPVAQLPQVGDAFRVDLERLTALAPDLVLVWASGNPVALRERVERLGVPTAALEPRTLDDVARHLELVGRLTGRTARAAAAARDYRAALARLKAEYAARAPLRVFYHIDDPLLYTVNGAHTISQMIELCGGRNVFADLAPLAPQVGEEAVVERDPQAIVVGGGTPAGIEARWRRWPGLTAVKRGALFAVDPDVVTRATPRLVAGARQICAALDAARAAAG